MDQTMYAFIERLLHDAGEVLLHYFRRRDLRVAPKGTDDLVTEADRAAEALLTGAIRERFPGHDILAEEAGRTGRGSRYLWLVDPLEATFNFSRGLPLWGINLALTGDGDVLYAAFFDPLLKELYYAERGQGALRNGQTIRTSGLVDLAGAAVYCSTASAVDRVSGRVRRFRHIGSIGNALAYVAAGHLDAAVEVGCAPWDHAAGRLLVTEAGGHVTATDGGALSMQPSTVLASATSELHRGLMELLADGASPGPSSGR
jgi:myo-inositol-1(or 4)-monophosphatase